ncbi:hypothetical protein K469DRAFT_692292 [Zopfia rhizophila CBS 207.26]|uniref:Uncharacterized protein n=1 Tax=Zopfia rhizophila CBS 207.26 TaxID=1314779 RepID=A0A6A6DPY2_9PEZI|nr:hypothetical protein K469DRAFT_692292 [Zopfia rhizophila CBS 207.26]
MNVLATRKLLEWGANPNAPNSEDGYPRDIVLWRVHKLMEDHAITLDMFKKKNTRGGKIRDAMDELTRPEEIFALLKDYKAKSGRELPPCEEKYTMPEWEEARLRQCFLQLGIDLRSIKQAVDRTDCPIAEIYASIISDVVSQRTEKALASSAEKLFRVQQYLADLTGEMDFSFHLEFNFERYGWRIELDELPAGFSSSGTLCTVDDGESASHDGKVPISRWIPEDLPRQDRPTQDIKLPLPSMPNSRRNMSAMEILRLEQLLPPEHSSIIIGPEGELGQLFNRGRSLPAGYRVLITGLTGGSHLSFTVGVKDGPARQPFTRAIPNGYSYTDPNEQAWNESCTDETSKRTDWSRFNQYWVPRCWLANYDV